MKNTILILAILFSGIFSTNAQESETFDLTIEVKGIKENKGKIFIAIYDSEENFLKKEIGVIADVKDKKATGILKGLKKGSYAVSLFHDENNNKKMDTKIFGIPKEPYGFSNDATGFMGPPKFQDAKFNLDSNKTITINVN
ncbi:DUF2141 domain-containing protein [Polaribacter glomeratus]|jgi:uncharacterized protein (DUF2141 family)|uniref:DUF2141 domain-containing protein n=1 Tax=Polaribacter glomeratus TaxID=102 RepID=A0A2S7WY86_9FLAO|nr:DUF2141 domain-containing protein [Polaribacter glomeratus]PQJ82486.1 hypothetical protein BTO16_07805 [Polaribacter glomeratus]TXD64275.1 DUF2141 domain-containing protein [Polaribacter glomeratus]